MTVDSAVPDRLWPAVRWVCTTILSWVLPLIAVERFVDEHYTTGGLLAALAVTDWVIVAKWDRIAEFISTWRRHLAFGFIALGAIFLVIGIYMLATSKAQRIDISQQQPVADIDTAIAPFKAQVSQLQAALDEMTQQRDAALRQSKPSITDSSPPAQPSFEIKPTTQGPITWTPGRLAAVVQVEKAAPDADPTVTLIKMYDVKNISSEPLLNLKAFVIAQLSSNELRMVFWDPKEFRNSDQGSILPGQSFDLFYDFRPKGSSVGIPLQDYLIKYGGITIRVEANGKPVFQQDFSYSQIKAMLSGIQDEHLAKKRLR